MFSKRSSKQISFINEQRVAIRASHLLLNPKFQKRPIVGKLISMTHTWDDRRVGSNNSGKNSSSRARIEQEDLFYSPA